MRVPSAASAAALAAAVFALGGCTPMRPDSPQTPTPTLSSSPNDGPTAPTSEATDWHLPGLVDPSGAPTEVSGPDPASGTTIMVTDADPDPGGDDDARAIREALVAAEASDTSSRLREPSTWEAPTIVTAPRTTFFLAA